MHRKLISRSWLGLVCLALLFFVSGQSCFTFGGITNGRQLGGTYTGSATLVMSITSDSFPDPISSSTQMQFSVTLNDDGRPQSLGMPAFGQNSGPIVTSLFATGQSHTTTTSLQIGSGGGGDDVTLNVTTTCTAVTAELTSTGFYAVYDFTITGVYSGGMLDGATMNVTGRAAYDGSVDGDTLTYSSSVTEDAATTMPGSAMQTAHYVVSLDASLTR